MRPRTTIAPCDSLGSYPQLATCESYCHILTSYSDAELTDVLSVAIGEKR